jgi:hypothetical protein
MSGKNAKHGQKQGVLFSVVGCITYINMATVVEKMQNT